MSSSVNSDLAIVRHVVATVAYRGFKILRDAPSDFGTFRIKADSRTPVEILALRSTVFSTRSRCAR